MKYMLVFLMIFGFSTGLCQEASMDKVSAKDSMLQADRDFSKLSVDKGMYAAFDCYMDDNATIYREGQHPFVGREAIQPLFPKEGGGTLEWEPTSAEIAQSGDLGYTLGKWTYTTTDSDDKETKAHGYYVSIWKKDANGNWKYVFDTGVSVKADDDETKKKSNQEKE